MRERVLITGGGGFIGSHLADELLAAGYRVRVLDALTPEVHGPSTRPVHLAPEAEFVAGDVRDPGALGRALAGVEAVCHLASLVGVGQSMYQIERYVAANDLGTATLLQALTERPVRRLVVASSMSVYGEGLYLDAAGRPVETAARTPERLRRGTWEPVGADDGLPLTPAATPEGKRPEAASVYALTKYTQERLCLIVGQAYGIEAVALRFFNVYGTRQALSNPYTGVLAIFAARLLNGRRPLVFEDGEQRRSFVDVRDVARACRLALEAPGAVGRAINVGGARAHTVREVAERLAAVLGREELEPEVTGRFRAGDIRHCYADVTLAREVLGFEAGIGLEQGLADLAAWLAAQTAAEDRVEQATRELAARGLVA